MHPRHLRKLQLDPRPLQPPSQALFSLRTPTFQPSPKLLQTWRFKEDVLGPQIRTLHLLHALHLDVQYAHTAPLRDSPDGLDAGAVVVAAEARVLYEGALGDEGFEGLGRDEVVVYAGGLPAAGLTGCVRDAETENRGVRGEEAG